MPLYRVLMRDELLDADRRRAFAGDVTRIHCDVTGAPPEFVHVVYGTDDGGALDGGQQALVFGTIRAGRTDEQKARLVSEMEAALAGHAGVGTDTVVALTADVPADWAMEGGRLLPEPGEEGQWLAEGDAT